MPPVVEVAERLTRLREVGAQAQRQVGCLLRLFQTCGGVVEPEPVEQRVNVRSAGVGQGEGRVQRHRPLEETERGPEVLLFLRSAAEVVLAPQEVIVCFGAASRDDPRAVSAQEGQPERADHLLRDLGLHPENVGEHRIVPIRPQMGLVGHPDELRRHPHSARPVGDPSATAPSPRARSRRRAPRRSVGPTSRSSGKSGRWCGR